MQLDITLLAATAAMVAGSLAFWSNPKRPINRLFLTFSVHAAGWLLCLRNAMAGGDYAQYWVRSASAVGAFVPLHLWLLRDASIYGSAFWKRARWTSLLVASFATIFAALSFTESYIPLHSSAARPIYGVGYYVYMIGVIAMYAILCGETIVQLRGLSGIAKVELQILLFGASAAACTIILLMAMSAVFGMRWLIRIQPLAILIFYTGTVIAMTTSRIFDARQILLVVLHKTALVGLITLAAFFLDKGFAMVLPEPFAFLATTAIALWLASLLNGWLDQRFQFYPQAKTARHAAFSAAQRESRVENLEQSFQAILKGWGQSERVLMMSGAKGVIAGGGVELVGDSTILKAIRQLRWATPERLDRERSTPERMALRQFMESHALGILVIEEGPALSVLIGVSPAASRRPFTYPQVTQLMELASIIEGALERAHFSAKVQHTEQLATVGLLGASLAHEIRNPLVSIKTFVQLLPKHHQDAAFREKFFKLIGDEVGRIDELTEQLLDLASPRTYVAEMVDLHPVLRASLDLVAAKASHKRVQFLTEFGATSDRAFTDASAAKQVFLNLCFNAIQAVESADTTTRWVKISTRNITSGIEMTVSDSGPGIPPEIRPRLFQPFQTTKSSGFGLGLAICSDILANLNASITVDPPAPGQGATFRVTFPCQPLSS